MHLIGLFQILTNIYEFENLYTKVIIHTKVNCNYFSTH